MKGAEAQWENALARLCRRCEFYYVGTGNPTKVLRSRKSPGFCRKVTRLPGAIVRDNIVRGSRGGPFTRALGAHLPSVALFPLCFLFQQDLVWSRGPRPTLDGHHPWREDEKARRVISSFASVCHLYLGRNGAFRIIAITSPLSSLLGISFPLIILIS